MLIIPFHNENTGSSCCGSAVTNLISVHEGAGSIPGPDQWVKDPVLQISEMRLGSQVAVAVVKDGSYTPVQSLAWEFPYAASSAIKKQINRSSHRGAVVNESD